MIMRIRRRNMIMDMVQITIAMEMMAIVAVPEEKLANIQEFSNHCLAHVGVSLMLPDPVGAGFHPLLSGTPHVSGSVFGDLRQEGQIG
jgi:hypothetical protein